MRYGYVRVSTKHQNTARQEVLMRELGVDRVFVDKQSGKDKNRPAFQEMMALLQPGDVVVVESYSRMSRNTQDLLDTIDDLREKGVGFISKKENLDTTTATGRLVATVLAGICQFERETMLERQAEGIAAMPIVNGKRVSTKTGRAMGRPNVVEDEDIVRLAESGKSVSECCKELGIGRSTWYARLKKTVISAEPDAIRIVG